MVKSGTTTKQLLGDIREELRALNRHMRVIAKQVACHNAAEIPVILRRIESNTSKQKVVD